MEAGLEEDKVKNNFLNSLIIGATMILNLLVYLQLKPLPNTKTVRIKNRKMDFKVTINS